MKILQKKVLFLTSEEKNLPSRFFSKKSPPLKIFCAQIQGKSNGGVETFFVPAKIFPWKIFCEKKKKISRPKYFPGNFLAGTKFSTPGGVICSFPQKEIFSEKIFPEKIHSKNMKSQFKQKKRHFFILFSQRLRFGLWIFFAEFQTLSSSF